MIMLETGGTGAYNAEKQIQTSRAKIYMPLHGFDPFMVLHSPELTSM